MRRIKLHHAILLAMVLAAAVGLPLNFAAERGLVDPGLVTGVADLGGKVGGLFLRLLQMLVVPLIVASLVTGVARMGDLRALGRLGWRTLAYYVGTSALAIATGIAWVNVLRPGVGSDLHLLEAGATDVSTSVGQHATSVWAVLWQQMESLIPRNPLAAAAAGDMLPVIFFSLVLGVFLNAAEHAEDGEVDESGERPVVVVRRFFVGLFDVMMRVTLWVISLAPIGVFGLMLLAAAGHGLAAFEALGMYALTVACALAMHALLTLPLVLFLLTRRSPLAFARVMMPALLTAFSTASSNGTLPLTMSSAEAGGIHQRTTSFVLPLGATINMDGTALYEAVAVLFIAQVYGLELGLGQQIIVAFTALLASVGAAGIPHAGTVMMVVVLSAVGLPTTAVGLILAVDRILDMCRTAVNVWSDSTAAAVLDRFARADRPGLAPASAAP